MSIDSKLLGELADTVHEALRPDILSRGAMLEVIAEVIRRIGLDVDRHTRHSGNVIARLTQRT